MDSKQEQQEQEKAFGKTPKTGFKHREYWSKGVQGGIVSLFLGSSLLLAALQKSEHHIHCSSQSWLVK